MPSKQGVTGSNPVVEANYLEVRMAKWIVNKRYYYIYKIYNNCYHDVEDVSYKEVKFKGTIQQTGKALIQFSNGKLKIVNFSDLRII